MISWEICTRSGKYILSARGGFEILTFTIVILLVTGADNYGRQNKKTNFIVAAYRSKSFARLRRCRNLFFIAAGKIMTILPIPASRHFGRMISFNSNQRQYPGPLLPLFLASIHNDCDKELLRHIINWP